VIENIHLLDNLASEAAERERQRLARDIHDSTIQPYIGFKLALESMRRRLPAGDSMGGELDGLIGVVNDGITDLRRYIHGLRTQGGSSDEALVPAIRRQAEKFTALYGINVDVRAGEHIHVNDRLAAEVFQLVREGLSNIRRHTKAHRAVVAIDSIDSRLRIRIENDSAGDLGQRDGFRDGFVPRSISERARSVGGSVEVDVRADGYTTVSVEIPT
jgi:signal transduction histidine kinase